LSDDDDLRAELGDEQLFGEGARAHCGQLPRERLDHYAEPRIELAQQLDLAIERREHRLDAPPEHLRGMRMERQREERESESARFRARGAEGRAVPRVNAVEIADGDQSGDALTTERARSIDTPRLHYGGFYYAGRARSKAGWRLRLGCGEPAATSRSFPQKTRRRRDVPVR
jgi:hypothetical protein